MKIIFMLVSIIMFCVGYEMGRNEKNKLKK